MLRRKIFSTTLIFWLLLVITVVPAYTQSNQPDGNLFFSPPPKAENNKLDSALNHLFDLYQEGGIEMARIYARDHWMNLEGERVQVTIYAQDASPLTIDRLIDEVEAADGEVQTWWQSQVQALVPILSLPGLASQPGIRNIRDPLRPELDITSEGVSLTNADDYRLAVGTSGEGVKIAILDLGFEGYQSLQTSGELPGDATINSFRADDDIEAVTNHGAACAEIVYDMAPDADYYFVNYETDTEYYNAVAYLESEAVNVVSHSISWFLSGPYDGSSQVSQRIDTARTNGIFWANSAGNRAEQHWEGYFANDSSGNHIWDSGSGVTINELGLLPAGTGITVYLSWDNWDPYGTNDYDLYLMYSGGSGWVEETSSTTDQSAGNQPPTEEITYTTNKLGFYGILVHKVSGSDRYLDLFTTRQDLLYPVAMGSIPNAADAAGAITVAAVDADNYNASGLEPFSSHGPVNSTGGGEPDYGNGSYTKPDISAPDQVSTVTYGTDGFGGTSAAAPHTAGAAALYISGYYNSYASLPSVDQTQSYLENCAEEINDWGTDTDGIKNNEFGAGGLSMCRTPTVVGLTGFSAQPQVSVAEIVLVTILGLLVISGALISLRSRSVQPS